LAAAEGRAKVLHGEKESVLIGVNPWFEFSVH
jgi:hypothetical protein